LKFSPKEPIDYEFGLPISLMNYGELEGLKTMLKCKGVSPKLFLEPQELEFKKKIIVSVDKCTPTEQEIILSNPTNESIK